MKITALVIWLSILLTATVALFWHVELVYAIPTPVPVNYHDVQTGQHIDIASRVNVSDGKPVLLHFFNPDCPCSKFNVPHFRTLVKSYAGRVNFVLVPVGKNTYTVKKIQDLFQVKLPVICDSSLARLCGVYSTPQAVIIAPGQTLYYRGNYNKSRYCADKQSAYAMMALDSLLQQKLNPVFNRYALKAYGCQIQSK